MLDISNLRVTLDALDGTDAAEQRALRRAVLRKLHLAPDDLVSIEPRKRSIDARKKSDVHLTYTVRASLRGGANAERELMSRLKRRHADKGVRVAEGKLFSLPAAPEVKPRRRPVVIGAGCAGLFRRSRTECARQIGAGNVSLNYAECLKADAPVKEGDVLSLRGAGKGSVREIGGSSRKGRAFVTAELYK